MNKKLFLHNIGKGINLFILCALILINLVPVGIQPVFAQSANPTFGVRANEDRIEGWEWPFGATVTIEIDDPTTSNDPDPIYATVGVADWDPNQTWFNVNVENYDLKTGDIVSVTDGNVTKTHTVTSLSFTDVNINEDIVTGMAASGSHVDIWACPNDGNCINRHVDAGTDGTWVADFGQFGDENDEQNTFDIVPGTWIDSSQGDEDGDSTMFGRSVPNPFVEAAPYSDWVHAREWPLSTLITMEIDDPSDGVGENDSNPVDYSATATMEQAPWNPGDPNDIVAIFDWPDQFAPGPGYVITMSGNGQSKTLTISQLNMTGYDVDADTISGIGTPGAQIEVCANIPDNCITRWVTPDGEGNWTANYHDPGTGSDDPETFDVQPGSNGWAAEYEDDSDRTWFDWSVADPRIEVSYEHDWIQIRDFTAGDEVTYTIYDYEGGHALFGPVTGPVDSHGDGWIAYNLHHTDLIPGNYITAVNEATGEEVSILVRDLNLDYVGVDDDIAFGTAEPNTTIEMHISETHNQGFNLNIDVDAAGYWEVDLAAVGHPIDSYRYADIRLYDAEGNNIFAQPPRIHAHVRSDNFSVDNFSKNADVTLTLYDTTGGTVLYGPVTLRTDGSGNTWVNLWPYGIDLVPGNYIIAYDHALAFTKSLEIEPFTFDGMNTTEDYIYGTSAVGEWVDLHVESLFSNWGLDALTDETGHWTRDYGVEDYDITDQMWAYGWAIDDQNNWSEDHTTGLPNIEASIADDWISGFNFSPDRQVRISFYDAEDGNLIETSLVTAWGDTQFFANYWDHGVDLQAGMYLLVEDLETGKYSELTLVPLTFDGVDYDADTAWGRADPGTQVVVRANQLFESHEITVIADGAGNWFADFSSEGADLTTDWDLRALVFDLEYDATVADAPRPPQLTASVDGDWISGENWTPNQSVSISVYESEGGSPVGTTITWNTNNYGSFYAELGNEGVDLLPGYHIVVEDNYSGVIKTITLPNLTIDYIDPVQDVAGGQAPADTRLSVDFSNQQESIQFDLFSESDGTWEADFAAHDFDLQPGSRGNVRLTDEDGDATQVDGYIPNPTFGVRVNYDGIEGWEWPFGATVTIEIDDPNTSDDPEPIYATVGIADWDPSQTYFSLNIENYDLKTGDIVTVTDGNTIKELTITPFEITGFDLDTEMVYGEAEANQYVNVWTCWENDPCIGRDETADGTGYWETDFSVPGEQDWEQDTADLQVGSWIDSSISDEDGDQILFGLNVLGYTLHVVPTHPEIHGHDWAPGSDVTLIIDADDDLANGTLYEDTRNVDDDPWCGSPCFDLAGVFDLEVGQYVTMTDGEVSKTVRVSTLTITEVDIENEVLRGTADPDSRVAVNIWSQDGLARYVTTEADGTWEADFSVFGDEDFEQFTTDITYGDDGRAIQLNPDGTDDGTLEYWYVDWVAPDTIPLVVAHPYAPDLNHPGYSYEDWTVLNLLLEPLFRTTDQGELVPAAATGYSLSPDGLVYTISLRDDMFWTDGEPVIAQQYVDGFLRLIAPGTATDYGYLLYDIVGAEDYGNGITTDPNDVSLSAINEHTLQIELIQPASHLPMILADPGMIPARLDVIEQYGDVWVDPANFVGNGPYQLLESDRGHLVMEKNPYYYDATVAVLSPVAFDIIGDLSEQVNAYLRDEVDVVPTAPNEAISDPSLADELVRSPSPGVIYIGINLDESPTDLQLVRQALASAIDRRALLDDVLGVPWLQTATGVIPPDLPGYQSEAVGYVYDPDAAQAWLAESGYPSGATVHLYGNTNNQEVLEAVADGWRTILGISVETHYEQNYNSFMRNCRDNPGSCTYNTYRYGWYVDYFDAFNILNDLFHPDSDIMFTNWDNDRYRELMDLIRAEQDPDQRIAYLQEAEQILVEDDAAIVPLYFLERFSLVKPRFTTVFGLLPYYELWNLVSMNHPPSDVVITAPTEPVPVNEVVTVQVDFNDPDENDSHSVVIDWGDMTNTDATVTGLTAVASHTYQSAGVYTIGATVTDTAGESAQAIYQYVVVYDPSGGFVTGGGWIDSPENAYKPDPLLKGKATFGFVSKYKKGASDPTGNTEFQFHAADLNFHSDSYDWLVVTGSDYARFKGTGTINGEGEYKFMLWAGDNDPDTFRIKIWYEDGGSEVVVYDNKMDQEIGGGSIVVHSK